MQNAGPKWPHRLARASIALLPLLSATCRQVDLSGSSFVTMADNTFSPRQIRVPVGGHVHFRNWGGIVHNAMAVRREGAQIVDRNIHESRLNPSRHDAFRERRVEHTREDRHDIELHRRQPFRPISPSGGRTTIRRPATSISRQNASTRGS